MRRTRLLIFALILMSALFMPALAQQAVQLDPSFDHVFGAQALNNLPLKVAVQSDGKILVVGNTNQFGGGFIPAGITRFLPDGTRDTTFNAGGTGSFGEINTLEILANGQILIGGSFLFYNGASISGLARLHPDGSLDSTFATFTGGGVSGNLPIVADIEVLPNGQIMISGGLTLVNGTPVNKIARLNADGSLDAGFMAPPGFKPNASARVTCMDVQGDGKIIAGGNFNEIDGVSYDRLVRFNTDGSLDPGFTADPSYNTDVSSMEVHDVEITANGKILASGNFKNALQRIAGIVRFLDDGNIDPTFNANAPQGTAGASFIESMALQSDGKIVIGGGFNTYNNVQQERITRLLPDGDLDPDFDATNAFSNNVHGVAIQADGKILAVGSFLTFDGDSATSVARLLGNGAPTGRTPALSAPDIQVFPNPFQGSLHLKGSFSTLKRMRLFDAHGRLLVDRPINIGNRSLSLELPELASGIYQLILEGNTWQKSFKLMRE